MPIFMIKRMIAWQRSGSDSGLLQLRTNRNRLANMTDEARFKEVTQNIEMVHGLPPGYVESIAAGLKTVNWSDEPWFRGALCY
jgi:monoamine oxidase